MPSESFINIKEGILGVMGNSSISLDPDAPEGRCRGTLLLRKSWKFKLEGNQAQPVKGACLKLCRGGSTLEGKLRYLGSLPSGPAASVFPEFSVLTRA